MLQRKDDQILALLNEKIKLFHDMCGSGSREDTALAIRMLFRACSDDMPKGENIMKQAIREGKWHYNLKRKSSVFLLELVIF